MTKALYKVTLKRCLVVAKGYRVVGQPNILVPLKTAEAEERGDKNVNKHTNLNWQLSLQSCYSWDLGILWSTGS